jgi:hypothetical protein
MNQTNPTPPASESDAVNGIIAQAVSWLEGASSRAEFEAFVRQQIATLAHPVGTGPGPATSTQIIPPAHHAEELLDFMKEHRIALVPEFEGGWDAQLYGEDADVLAYFSGATPRQALEQAMQDKKDDTRKRASPWP